MDDINAIFYGKGTDADNSAKRLPVALCLDTSKSMAKSISELNEAVKLFYEQCKSDYKAKNTVEIIAIEFGGEVNVVSSFSEAESAQIPHFNAGGGTPMGKAVKLALDCLEQRKEWYKEEGIAYYQPILILMTDGGAADNITKPGQRIADMVANKKLLIIPLAFGKANPANEKNIGKHARNIAKLETLAGGKKAVRIEQGFHFMEFFKWLSSSISGEVAGQNVDFENFRV